MGYKIINFKLFWFLLCSLWFVVFFGPFSTFSASPVDFQYLLKKVHINSSLKIFVNNKETTTDVPPVEYGAYIFVPLRFVVENFGAQLKWNNKTKEVKVSLGEKGFILKNDSFEIKAKNENISLPASVFIYKGRIMIPLELSATVLGGSIKKENKKIYVTTLKKVTSVIKEGKKNLEIPKNLIKKDKLKSKETAFYNWPKLNFWTRIKYVINKEILHNSQNKFMGPLVIIMWFVALIIFFKEIIFNKEKNNEKILKKIVQDKQELMEDIKSLNLNKKTTTLHIKSEDENK